MFAPSGSAEGANKPSGPPKTFFSMLSSTPSSTPTLFGGPSTLAPPPRDSNGLTTTTARGDHHASDHGLDVTMADASTSGAGSSSKGLTLAPAMSGRLQFGAMPVASSSRVKERDLFVPFDGPSLAFGARAASKTTPREYGPDEIEDWRSDQIEAKQSELAAIVDKHDDHVRELFHLDRFVTLVGYDPVAAKQDKSDVFLSFQQDYDLYIHAVPEGAQARPARRAARRAATDRKVGIAESALSRRKSDTKGKGRADDMYSYDDYASGGEEAQPKKRNGKHRRSSELPEDDPTPAAPPTSNGLNLNFNFGGPNPNGRSSTMFGGLSQPSKPPATFFGALSTSKTSMFQFPTSSSTPLTPPSPKRVKWGDGPPPPPTEYSHHFQVPPTPAYDGSLSSLLSSYYAYSNDQDVEPPPSLEDLETRAEEEASVLVRIDELRAEGRELGNPDRGRSNEPKRIKDHHESLLEHVVHFSKLVHDERKSHMAMGRRISRMILAHFAGIRGKEEREEREEQKHKKALARWTVREVRKKWKMAINVVKARRKARDKEEQALLGKQQLNAMLDKSTSMLQAQQVEMAGDDSDSDAVQDDSDSDKEQEPTEDTPEVEIESEAPSEVDSSAPGSPAPVPPPRSRVNGRPRFLRGRSTLSTSATPLDSPASDSAADPSESDAPLEGGDDDVVFEAPEDDARAQEDDAMEVEMEAEDDEEDETELGGLAEEADMPLDELLRRSGYAAMVQAEAAGELEGTSDGASEIDEEDDEAEPAVVASPAVDQPTPAPPTPEPVSTDDKALTTEEMEAEALSEFGSDAEDDARDDEDAKLAQEMEADEGDGGSDDSEMNGLAEDADLPIEELMRKYGYGNGVVDPTANGVADSPAVANGIEAGSASPEGVAEGVEEPELEQEEEDGQEEEDEDEEVEEDEDVEEMDDDRSNREVSPARVNLRPPFLLRATLRPYQQAGLEWLAGLYTTGVNGILADEMGLGKTIQTISLLAHLACDKGQWGPHLVVVPTSVMLNWEMEFKKFLPGFKILTYYGSQKERKEKRRGWNTENHFHVCVTSYQLVLADQHMFRRKPWHYMILDEAHHIKNFRSQRWQTLLGFNARHRLLLTGTPLQNNLMELWSLLYFLMPHGLQQDGQGGPFADHADFQAWFSNPMEKAIENGEVMDEETKATVSKLHTVLRPYLLRRLKAEVETQMPGKTESVVYCRLSKRQRFLYDDFMSRSQTRETLGSGHFLSIINCLMQLRKVCNHPDLFEVRPIVTSFAMNRSVANEYEPQELLVRKRLLDDEPIKQIDWSTLTLLKPDGELSTSAIASNSLVHLDPAPRLSSLHECPIDVDLTVEPPRDTKTIAGWTRYQKWSKARDTVDRLERMATVNSRRLRSAGPFFGSELLHTLRTPSREAALLPVDVQRDSRTSLDRSTILPTLVRSLATRAEQSDDLVARFGFVTPKVKAADMPRHALAGLSLSQVQAVEAKAPVDILQRASAKLSVAFPDRSLLQYDCGKLQKLDELLRECKAGGHRVLIFTQMTKVLDILEEFLSFHGHRYLRLDGSTKIEQRQIITERFNSNDKILCFISSTRSGGLGINLQGADTVIFYDSDWNPALDRQCQDRAHRIGQTREVRIWRFVTEHSIEENMLKKANQKRRLDEMVIAEGDFTTDYLQKLDWRDYLDEDQLQELGVDAADPNPTESAADIRQALAAAEDEEDAVAAKAAVAELAVDRPDFSEQVVAPNPLLAPAGSGADGSATPQLETPAEEEEEEEDDPLKGQVDGYMVRFVERNWDLLHDN